MSHRPDLLLYSKEHIVFHLQSRIAYGAACSLFIACIILLLPPCAPGQAPDSPTFSAAFQSDLNAAGAGDTAAQLRVAKAYNEGTTGTHRRNYIQALKWFQSASQAGSIEAGAWLGSLYLLGHGPQQDVSRAAALIQQAAGAGDPVGLRFLGVMYESGQGVAQDYNHAFSVYSTAAAKGDIGALNRLALLYLRGLGVPRDDGKAFELLTQAVKAGDSEAQLYLGEMYERGAVPASNSVNPLPNTPGTKLRRSPPDYANALRLFESAAAQDNRVAAFKLGQMYEHGWGTTQDYDKAFEYYEQSGTHQYAPALLAIGRMHEAGLGTAVNLVHAYIAYSLVAEQNNPEGDRRLQLLIPKMTQAQIEDAHNKLKQVKSIRAQVAAN